MATTIRLSDPTPLFTGYLGRGIPSKAPVQYSLGRGHVLFFYTRLGYCSDRIRELVAEMDRRGFRAQFRTPPRAAVPAKWMSLWYPTEEAMNVNRERIKQRTPK